DHRRGRQCQTVPVEPLQSEAENNRTPADIDGRGIEVRDRRSALQVHPRAQRPGVNQERKYSQAKCGPTDRSGPTEPGAARQEKDDDIERGTVGEWLEVIEECFQLRTAG